MASCIHTWFPYAWYSKPIFAPLSLDYFIEHVAVPQCAALLVADDQDVSSEDVEKLIRTSAEFGVALHPVDEDNEDPEVDQIQGFIFGHSVKYWQENEDDNPETSIVCLLYIACLSDYL